MIIKVGIFINGLMIFVKVLFELILNILIVIVIVNLKLFFEVVNDNVVLFE